MKVKTKKEKKKILLGAHMSSAGGVHKAVERAVSIGCTALQLFTKNNNQWFAKKLEDEVIENYKKNIGDADLSGVVSHDSYLINLCAANPDILKKSRASFQDELERCELLGIPYLNFHPGAHVGAGEEEGLKKIIESLDIIHDKTKNFKVLSVVEVTAGQGTTLGYKFEQINKIITGVQQKNRMAVCIDTCHIFAAGYDISTEKGYEKTFKEFEEIVGLEKLVAFHVNDSKKGLASKVDRHEHIGKGEIGLLGFKLLMNDERFDHIPKILETPKEEDMLDDIENMKILKKLIKK
ncbi:MAG: deoxyribonuclease IV [Ignavibacteria bacterium]|nr:deoxyribonuclease IV [Bacteroidota bacterium]MSQ46448.1 deoxyribonuclease IV [Ignavibacteria bacterium]